MLVGELLRNLENLHYILNEFVYYKKLNAKNYPPKNSFHLKCMTKMLWNISLIIFKAGLAYVNFCTFQATVESKKSRKVISTTITVQFLWRNFKVQKIWMFEIKNCTIIFNFNYTIKERQLKYFLNTRNLSLRSTTMKFTTSPLQFNCTTLWYPMLII